MKKATKSTNKIAGQIVGGKSVNKGILVFLSFGINVCRYANAF